MGYEGSQGGWEKKKHSSRCRAPSMSARLSPLPLSLSCQPAIVGVQDPHLSAGGQSQAGEGEQDDGTHCMKCLGGGKKKEFEESGI